MWLLCACRTELHFVRCIKPNNEQAQEDYDAALVLHQLRCCGITEVARIARAGYPTRYAHQQFAQRYSSLLGNRVPRELLRLVWNANSPMTQAVSCASEVILGVCCVSCLLKLLNAT